MSILIDKNTKVICQGFTGKAWNISFRTSNKIWNTISWWCHSKKGGQKHLNLPVFDTVKDAKIKLEQQQQ